MQKEGIICHGEPTKNECYRIPSCFYVLLFDHQARDAAVVQGVWHLDRAYIRIHKTGKWLA